MMEGVAMSDEQGIACPNCGCRHFVVSYGRDVRGGHDRIKRCRHCKTRVRTTETLKAVLPPTKADVKLFDISNYFPANQAQYG